MAHIQKKKRERKGKITKLNEPFSIYSTLSKKPADLETSDIDLSAVRVFLGDGSHRTLSSSPTAQCGEILNRLLEKLGLSDQREQYGLQIHYKYSEPRVPEDWEELASLNVHVYDSVDKIYLYKKSDTFVMMPLRKRVASYSKRDSEAQDEENIYENWAVGSGYCRESNEDKYMLQPVLVNDKLASKFAKAWTTAADGNSKPSKEIVRIETPPQLMASEAHNCNTPDSPIYSSYTIDRQHKKLNTLKRQKPVTQSPRSKQEPFSPLLSPMLNNNSSPVSVGNKPSHFKLPLKSSLSLTSSSCSTPDIVASETEELYAEIGPLITNPLHKSSSEGCLLSACNSEESKLKKSSSIEVLRDSGFHDSSPPPLPPPHRQIRRKSISLNNIPLASKAPPQQLQSKSTSALVFQVTKAHAKLSKSNSNNCVSTINASSLKSYKSMELLTEGDFKTIGENISHQSAPKLQSFSNERIPKQSPPVPKRNSSLLENCTISDDYLLKQGKRLSQVLNINATIKPEEKGHFRSFFAKVGTILTGKKKAASSCISLSSPQSPRPTMAPIEFIQTSTSHIAQSSLSKLLEKTDSQDPTCDRSSDDDDGYVKVVPSNSSNSVKQNSGYDVAVSHPPVFPKAPIPNYLSILPPNNSPGIYNQCETNNVDFYQTPPPQPHPRNIDEEGELYENKFIQSGENGMITLDGSMLHDYQTPPPSSAVKITYEGNELYENSAIKGGTKGAIIFNNQVLHDYQTPPSRTDINHSSTTILQNGMQSKEVGESTSKRQSSNSIYKEHVADWVRPSSSTNGNKMHNHHDPINEENKEIDEIYDAIVDECDKVNQINKNMGENVQSELSKEKFDEIYDAIDKDDTENDYDHLEKHYDHLAHNNSEEIYDNLEVGVQINKGRLQRTLSEPDLLYEIPGEYTDSSSEDEYMLMQPNILTEALHLEHIYSKPSKRKSRASKYLKSKSIIRFPKPANIKAQPKIEELRAKFLSSISNQHEITSNSQVATKKNSSKNTFEPSKTSGVPPKFAPTAPKPKYHKVKQTIAFSRFQNSENFQYPPPATLEVKKESPKLIISASTPLASPPTTFKISNTISTKKIPLLPPSRTISNPVVASSPEIEPNAPNKSFLIPRVTTLTTPPPPGIKTLVKETASSFVSEIAAKLEHESSQFSPSSAKAEQSSPKPVKNSVKPLPPPPPAKAKPTPLAPLIPPSKSLSIATKLSSKPLPLLPLTSRSTPKIVIPSAAASPPLPPAPPPPIKTVHPMPGQPLPAAPPLPPGPPSTKVLPQTPKASSTKPLPLPPRPPPPTAPPLPPTTPSLPPGPPPPTAPPFPPMAPPLPSGPTVTILPPKPLPLPPGPPPPQIAPPLPPIAPPLPPGPPLSTAPPFPPGSTVTPLPPKPPPLPPGPPPLGSVTSFKPPTPAAFSSRRTSTTTLKLQVSSPKIKSVSSTLDFNDELLAKLKSRARN